MSSETTGDSVILETKGHLSASNDDSYDQAYLFRAECQLPTTLVKDGAYSLKLEALGLESNIWSTALFLDRAVKVLDIGPSHMIAYEHAQVVFTLSESLHSESSSMDVFCRFGAEQEEVKAVIDAKT